MENTKLFVRKNQPLRFFFLYAVGRREAGEVAWTMTKLKL